MIFLKSIYNVFIRVVKLYNYDKNMQEKFDSINCLLQNRNVTILLNEICNEERNL